ncbi:MAG: c-type cytochrome [Cyclobacteriaceae bacterium]|nr:c-type cytochrome [Cyclobacteriaceae bacterium]
MFKYYLEQIQNVSIWPIISLTIFFGFFILLLLWLIKVDKKYINKMKNLPLDTDTPNSQGRSKAAKIGAVFLMLLVPQWGFAQAAESSWDQETVILWVLILVIIIAILVLMVAIYTLNVLQLALRKPEESVSVKKQGWWQKFWEKINDRVPQEKERDILLDHNYDGIRELDNHLPPWWTALFYITIVIGVIYMFVYHVFESAPLPGELYEIEVAEADAARAELLALESEAVGNIDESTVEFDNSEAVLQNGQQIYDMQCASCHRDDGGGGIGPNLTDAYWIHGGSMQDVFKIVKYGVPQKGMISWEPLLSPVQMRDVSSYILSLVGTDPPNGKTPQGELYQADAE